MIKSLLLAIVAVCAVAGCKTQTTLTADATGCRVTEVDVIKSRYSRDGTTTAWCAKCKGKIYHCVSNPERSRVECKEPSAENICE